MDKGDPVKPATAVALMFYLLLAACAALVALVAWKIAHPLPWGL